MELARLEEKVFLLGMWKSIDEMEDNITLGELHRHFLTHQENEYNDRAFTASLKGVKLDPWVDPDEEETSTKRSSFEEIKERAALRAAIANGDVSPDSHLARGLSEPQAFEGFGYIEEE